MKNPFSHNHRYLAAPPPPLHTTPQVSRSLFVVTVQRIRFLIFWNFRSSYLYVINLCFANSQRSCVCYIVGILSKSGFSFLLFWRCILFRLYMAGRWIENLSVYNYWFSNVILKRWRVLVNSGNDRRSQYLIHMR